MDAERMLFGLVRNAMGGGGSRRRRRRGRSKIMGVSKGALGMGALGVAIAAFEHITDKQKTSGSTGSSTPPPALPPLPGQGEAALPDLPPVPGSAPSGGDGEALLVVRSMIAAANADFEVDDEERRKIEQALEESELADDEKRFLLEEIEHPVGIATLAEAATTPVLAREVYLASLMAIDADSAAERNYLARLAGRLGIDETEAAQIEGMIERGPSGS